MDNIKYRDLDLDFVRHPITNDVSMKINAEAVRRSVRNLILLNLADKPFHPEISTNLSGLLFENITPQVMYNLKQIVLEILKKYEARVKPIDIKVKAFPDDNSIYAMLQFQIVNIPGTFDVQIPIVRTR